MLSRAWRSRFARNVAIVASGTAGAQAITMAFSPLITRIYGPDAFGVLGTFNAIASIIVPLAALSYPIAIVLPKKDSEALALMRLAFMIALAASTIAALALVVWGEVLLESLRLAEILPYALMIPLMMIFGTSQTIVKQWSIRKHKFSVNSKVAVVQAFITNGLKVSLGVFYPLAGVLIGVAIAGQALHTAMLAVGVKLRWRATSNQGQRQASASLARRYSDFPLYRTPQVVINGLSQSLPVIMLAAFFGPASAGFYSLGKTVLGLPTALIGASVVDVFYPRINEAAQAKEDPARLIGKATSALAAVGIVPFGVVVLFGPWLFEFVFGSEWGKAGEYARWLALWSYFGFMNRASVAAIPVLSLQRAFLLFEIASVALRAGALGVGVLIFEDDLLAVILFSLVSVLLNASLIMFTVLAARKPNRRLTVSV